MLLHKNKTSSLAHSSFSESQQTHSTNKKTTTKKPTNMFINIVHKDMSGIRGNSVVTSSGGYVALAPSRMKNKEKERWSGIQRSVALRVCILKRKKKKKGSTLMLVSLCSLPPQSPLFFLFQHAPFLPRGSSTEDTALHVWTSRTEPQF